MSTQPAQLSGAHALSASQQELWYWQKQEPLSAAYNEGLVFELDPCINIDTLRQAFCSLAQHHAVLRTVYAYGQGRPMAVITDNQPDFLVQEIADHTNEELYAIINEAYNLPFDLAASVMRIRVYLRPNEAPLMLAAVHHIACDGWSLKVLWTELMYYYAFPGAAPPVARPTYNDHVLQEQQYLAAGDSAAANTFWKAQLEDAAAPLRKEAGKEDRAAHAEWPMNAQQVDALRQLARRHGCSLYDVLCSMYHFALSFATRETSVLIGTPFLNREAAFRQVAGYFVNAAAIRHSLEAGETFAAHIQRVHAIMLAARDHARYPLAAVKAQLQQEAPQHFSYFFSVRNRLFDISAPEGAAVPFTYTVLDILVKHDPQFDLHLEVFEGSHGARAVFHYNAAVITASWVGDLAGRWLWLADAVAADAQVATRTLMQLPAGAAAAVMALGRGPEAPFDIAAGYSTLFFRQAEQSGHRMAICDARSQWTYEALAGFAAKASAAIAAQLPAGAPQHPIIAVCMQRCCEQVGMALAIWRMGGIYMPIDPSLPAARINYMLADAGSSLLITDGSLPDPGMPAVDAAAIVRQDHPLPAPRRSAAHDGAYLLYTSGSTGRPKGVLVSAAGMLNHQHAKCSDLQLDRHSVVAQTASVSFDVSIWQTFAALLAGGCIRIYERNEVLNIRQHLAQLQRDGITVLQVVPPYLRELLHEAVDTKLSAGKYSIRHLVSAGESLDAALAKEWFDRFPGTSIANCYGPTEAADNISLHLFGCCDAGESIPAGRPLANMQLYVVDSLGEPCQPGVMGEIWVSGPGVAGAYIGAAAERSAEVFMDDPFRQGRKLYKTGDLGMWGNDGLLHFCGRRDTQVKLRGQRVELQEVEQAIRAHGAVKQAAVVYSSANGGSLAAYVQWKGEAATASLRSHLQERLAAYMIPAHTVSVESMPLTASGKLDRQRLPSVASTSGIVVDPVTDTEAALLQLWKSVLGKDAIGTQHHFFEHGGHSLKAVQLVSQIEQQFAISLSVSSLHTHPTVAALAKVVDAAAGETFTISPAPDMPYYPASAQQQLIWSVCMGSAAASAAYNMTGFAELDGSPGAAALCKAVAIAIGEQESLSVNLQEIDGTLCQVPRSEALPEPAVMLVSDEACGDALRAHAAKENATVFDLENDWLVRLAIIVSTSGKTFLAGTIHHIIADGMSLQLLLERIKTICHLLASGKPVAAMATTPSYRHYAWWQQQWLSSPAARQSEAYLLSLTGSAEPLDLPADLPRPLTKSFHAGSVSMQLPKTAFEGKPPAAAAISAIHLALEAFTGQEQVTTGLVLTGRHRAVWHRQVGLFMNTLPLALHITGSESLENIMAAVGVQLAKLQDHQAYPCYSLLQRQPALSGMLQKVLVNYMRTDDAAYAHAYTAPSSKAELEFECRETNEALTITLVYEASLFETATASQLLHCCASILQQCIAHPALLVKELRLMEPAAQQLHLRQSGGKKKEYPVQKNYAQLFSEAARRCPGSTAVSDMQHTLTYAQLDEWSAAIAAGLQSHLTRPQSVVAAWMGRSAELVAVVLGIWKAGAIYLPLDPSHPAERNEYILNDAGVSLVICGTGTEAPQGLPAVSVEALAQDEKINVAPVDDDPAALSYIIYTSGSTGRPKGVMVEQRGMVNHLYSRVARFELNAQSKVAQIASHTFDISVWQLFAVLLAGGQVQIFPNAAVKDTAFLVWQLQQKAITHFQVVPTYLSEMLHELENERAITLPSLLAAATIGEELKRSLAERWMQRIPSARLFNTYGPTEASDTICDYELEAPLPARVPIGQPIDNLSIYILDRHGRLCPPAICGEVCVSGIGVGQGYIGLPEKTSTVFLNDPFESGARMYRTGDAGRWNASGLLEYHGRKDLQVKLFGNRIELAEIEQVILSSGIVKQAAAMVQSVAGHPVLTAYVVWNEQAGKTDPQGALHQHITRSLPGYMIPAQTISLESMPLTSSGKTDRKRLPLPGAATTRYEAPANETEQLLCGIWEAVLGRTPVGRHDNFFALGGHSLKATQLVMRIHRHTGCRLDLAQVFAHPTIASLSGLLINNTAFVPIPRLQEAAHYAVSPAQQRIWVLSHLSGGNQSYNITGCWRLSGKIDTEKFRQAVTAVVQRHESLRTGFSVHGVELRQFVQPHAAIEKIIDIATADDEQAARRLLADTCTQRFDLAAPGLLSIRLVRLDDDTSLLACAMHHIIADGWSVQAMLREVSENYAALVNQRSPHAAPLPVQYRDYAAWLNEELQGARFAAARDYWLSLLPFIAPLPLPADHQRPSVQSFRGGEVSWDIPLHRLERLRAFAQQRDMSVFMVLLSSVNLLLHRHTGQQRITVGSAVSGREHPDTQDVIGCFINTILLSLAIHPQSLVQDFLESVRSNTMVAYAHQAYPFDQLLEASGRSRDLSRNALFDVLVNYQSFQQPAALQLDGLHVSDYKAVQSIASKLDLEFVFNEFSQHISARLVYDAALFDHATAVGFTTQLNTLLDDILLADEYTTVQQLTGRTEVAVAPQAHDTVVLPAPSPVSSGANGHAEAVLLKIWQQVLAADNIGTQDNFFLRGGHSLKAIRLASAIGREFDVNVRLEDIFFHPTIQQQAALLDTLQAAPPETIAAEPDAQHYPLSGIQQRMWILSQLPEGGHGYNVCGALRMEGLLNVPAWKQAWKQLLQRHEVLRTIIVLHEGEPRQQIVHELTGDWDMRHEQAGEGWVENIYRVHERHVFDLEHGPLVMATLVHCGADKYYFIFALHHVAADEWTLGILRNDLLQLYAAACLYEQPVLPPAGMRYRDYAAWESRQDYGAHPSRAYWLQQFSGELPVLELPADKPRPASATYQGGSIAAVMAGAGEKATLLAAKEHGTLFMALAATVNVLLMRYCHQHDIVVGLPVSGRGKQELDNSAGPYLNTLPLRTVMDGNASFLELLAQVKENILHAFMHRDYPYDRLVEALAAQHGGGRPSLFDVSVVMHESDIAGAAQAGGLRVQAHRFAAGASKFDLSFHFTAQGHDLHLELIYNTSLFTELRAQRILSHFVQLMHSVLADPGQRINALEYVPSAERHQLLYDFQGQAAQPAEGNAWLQFETAALANAGVVAVMDETTSLTYGRLHEQATALAACLEAEYEIGGGSAVAIRMSRSVNMVVSILAVWKLGGTYVPIDRSFPQERVDYLLADSNAALLISDDGFERMAHETPAPQRRRHAGSIAYIIYTSGTTGKPKGVRITDGALLHYVQGIGPAYQLNDYQHLSGLLASSIAFDLGYTCLWGMLLRGATLHLAAESDHWEPRRVLRQLAMHKIGFIKLTPSHFRLLLQEALLGQPGGECLQLIVLGGEQIVPSEIRQWLELYPHCRIANHYGPTETTVGVLTQVISLAGDGNNEMSLGAFEQCPVLGRPIGTHAAYVVDDAGRLCGQGVWGELWISGPGVSPGYVNQMGLTKERFMDDPFRAGHRLYRSGDKARWTTGGHIAFGGRMDEQLQLNGYRVEPAEIERVLLSHGAITSAAVTALPGSQRLVAYIVSAQPAGETSIKNYLQQKLPAYMMPWKLVSMDALPLTPNGKINKKLLPAPLMEPAARQQQPVTRAGAQLLEAFAAISGTHDVGITEHFFEAGGDSIRAIQLSALLYRKGWKLDVKDILKLPRLEDMAAAMQPLESIALAEQVPTAAHYEVSAAQRRLWFISQLEDNPTVYNTLSALAIEGHFNPGAFAGAIRLLAQRHESLRTTFTTVDDRPKQVVHAYDSALHGYEFIDLSGKQNRNALLEEIFRAEGGGSFDLVQGPLFRVKLVRMHEHLHVFVMNMHHIISDGWSKSILEEEFLLIYKSLLAGAAPQLPEPVYQYKDYAAWQQQHFMGASDNVHSGYWKRQLSGELPILQFPTDYARPSVKTYASKNLGVVLPPALAASVRELATREQTTPFTVLLAAVQVLLKRYAGQDDIITGIPAAGRQRPEFSRIVGLFLNLLPVRTRFAGNEPFLDVLRQLKDNTADAYAHEDFPFDLLVEQLHIRRDLSRSALFDVLVVSEDFGLFPGSRREEDGYAVKEMETGFSGNKFDLTFYFRKAGDGISLIVGYNAAIFRYDTIQRLAAHFENLLSALVRNPAHGILTANYLTEQEMLAQKTDFNDTIRPYSNDKLLHQLFEAAAARTPQGEALRHRRQSMTYDALNRAANALARSLQAKGLGVGDNAGILTGRTFSMITGMLAILKAGAAYVPIDPAYPADRQSYIIANSGIRCIVTDDADIARSAAGSLENITIVDIDEDVSQYDCSNLSITKPVTDLAYTIYTSGSSGRPKGVMIEHHSAVNLVEWVNVAFSVNEHDRMLFITSMCFDLSVYDIFGILAAGGCIVMAATEDVQELHRVKQLLLDERITFWDTVPTTLQYLVTELGHSREPFVQYDLRVAFMSGDWIPVSLPAQVRKFFPSVQVISLGGATEGTVWSNYYPITEVGEGWRSIPYGRPITNNFFYILDDALNPVPQGVTGELFIGGVGVSRGYINDKAKTDAAFLPDPFCKALGGRMYKTGDLGRMLPDGNMEFLGRKDFQVKIRGFRVELGEIEQVLSKFPGIQTALVNAAQDHAGIKYLAAYYTGEDEFPRSALSAFLSRQLPEYMVPAFYVKLDSFPLNTNGKIDRKALPLPVADESTQACLLLPRTATEKAVAGIWSGILNKELFGVQDNFFSLGGHSLSASQVVARIREEMEVPLKLPSIFINPTVEQLSNEIDALRWVKQQPQPKTKSPNKIII